MINATLNCFRFSKGISLATRAQLFGSLDVCGVRKVLERHGHDRHMLIEARSTEIAIVTPKGIVMQVRSDENHLGLWGGELGMDEFPLIGAQRELFEETKLWADLSEFKFVETYTHRHTYPNGDKCLYHTFRYVLRYPKVPPIKIDSESIGFEVVRHTFVREHEDFIERILSA